MAHDAKTRIELPSLAKIDYMGRAVIALAECRTYKGSNGQLWSTAHVSWVDGTGSMTTEIFGDFSRTYARANAKPVTQAKINGQHAEVFSPANLDIVKEHIVAFYEAKRAKAA